MTNRINYNRTSPYSHISLLIFKFLNSWINRICQIIKKHRIKYLIINILISLLFLYFIQVKQIIPFFFHIFIFILLYTFHYLSNPQTLFSDLNTKLFTNLILSCMIISITTVFKYFFIILVTKYDVWTDVVDRMSVNVLENWWICYS